jgi:hypothetical protein
MAFVNFKYAILLDEDGHFKGLEDLGDEDGVTLLTLRPEERTSAPVPHFFGDNGSYVLGIKDAKPDQPLDVVAELKKNNEFVEKNIFKSVANVNLDTLIEYKKDGVRHNFLDDY